MAIPELLRLAPDLPAETRQRWGQIEYCHALCPIFELPEPFTPYYWLNIGDASMPFGGLIEQTNFLPASLYGGRHVVYISNYVLPDDPKWTLPDRDRWEIYLPAAIRLAILAHHYREDWDWTDEGLTQAQQRLAAWRAAASAPAAPPADDAVAQLRARLADDLDAPGALAAVDRWAEATRLRGGSAGHEDAAAGAAVRDAVDALLGVAL